jgi:hypothetical protein
MGGVCKKSRQNYTIYSGEVMEQNLKKFDPAVDKRLLIALSGITWLAVGIILCAAAIHWLSPIALKPSLLLVLTGIVLALLIHHFGFLRLVDTNIERIMAMKDKVCIFAFQAWKSYAIIAIMVAMGMALRQSQLPRPYLSVIYIGFGGAMMLSSIRYIRIFLKQLIRKVESRK